MRDKPIMSKRNKQWVKEHRLERYYSAIQKRIDYVVGNSDIEIPQSYVDERFKKLKEIK